jgi:hypothetical protein
MIEVDTKQAEEKLKQLASALSPREVRTAFVRSLNRGAQYANTQAKRAVRERYNVKSYNMEKMTKTISANQSTMTAKVAAEKGTLSFSAFNPTAVQTMGASRIRGVFQRKGGKRGGVQGSYATKLGQGQGIYIEIIKGQKEYLPGAFMGFWNKQGSASGGAIFARGKYTDGTFKWAKGRAPITKLKTKSVYWSILNDAHNKKIMESASNKYEAELLRQLQVAIENPEYKL